MFIKAVTTYRGKGKLLWPSVASAWLGGLANTPTLGFKPSLPSIWGVDLSALRFLGSSEGQGPECAVNVDSEQTRSASPIPWTLTPTLQLSSNTYILSSTTRV